MESTDELPPKQVNWAQLDRDVGLLRLAAKEIYEAGPRALEPYADRIRLLAELADSISRGAYAGIRAAAERAADTRRRRQKDYDI